MSFLVPAAFAFAAAIPIVVVFYLLKRKRTAVIVPSTLLWQRFLAESQASSPFQRLRYHWLLVLQILMLLLAVFGLSRPFLKGQSPPARLQVLVLDTSASMKSTDVSPNRFEVARSKALELVDGLGRGDLMVVIEAGARTQVKQSPTSEAVALRRAIRETRATDGPTRLIEALRLAHSLTQEQNDAVIHLVSDGAVDDLDEFENKGLNLRFHRVGERSDNLGIVSLDVRTHPEDPALRAVFAGIANSSDAARSSVVELLLDGLVIDSRAVTVEAGETAPIVFTAQQQEDGLIRVRLSAEDDLAVDNEATMLSLLPRPVNVLLVTAGNRFLERALAAVPNVRLRVEATYAGGATGADVVVLDNVVPAQWPEGNVLAIRVAGPGWFSRVTPLDVPAIVDWRNTHGLLRFVNFEGVQIADALGVEAPPWGLGLVDAPAASLIVAGEIRKQRILWIGFDVLESNWPLLISFPIFIANSTDWLDPSSIHAGRLSIQSGTPLRLPMDGASNSVQVTRPSGESFEYPVDPESGEIVIGETDQQGVYQVAAGTNTVAFAVNLLDARESDVRPRDEITFGRYGVVEASVDIEGTRELWRWFLALGLIVLLFEWWFYHKRTA